MRKAEKCEGVTVLVGGRRVKRSDLLLEQLKLKQKEYDNLAKANGLFKAKEVMQLSQLDGYETCLHHTAMVLQAAATDSEAQERLLPAMMLDIKAFELMQQLTPHGKFLLPTHQAQLSSPPAAGGASPAPSGDSDATAASLSTAPGRSHSSRAGTCRTARCLAAISTEEVRECRSWTAQELAVRFKDSLARVALVQRTQSGPLGMGSKTLEAAVDEVVRLTLLGIMTADKVYMEALCLNMETVQPEAPPDELWPSLVQNIRFSPQQQQQLATAWELYSQQKGVLLQQQAGVVQRLQALLSTQGKDASLLPEQDAGASSGSRVPSFSSSSGSCQSFDAALLLLESAEEVERLLSEVLRITQHLTQQQRRLVTFYINNLTSEQHISVALNAYPFFISPSKLMECLWRQVQDGRRSPSS